MLGFGRSRCRRFTVVESLLSRWRLNLLVRYCCAWLWLRNVILACVWVYGDAFAQISGCVLSSLNWMDCSWHKWTRQSTIPIFGMTQYLFIKVSEESLEVPVLLGECGYYSVDFNPVVMFDGVLFSVWQEILIKVAKVVAEIHLPTPHFLQQHLLRPLTLLWFSLQYVQINPRFTVSDLWALKMEPA